MNRPTIDVDELLEMADEALAARDFRQAVEILRKATSVAPLRKDIRNRLAMALEGTPVSMSGQRNIPEQPADILDLADQLYDHEEPESVYGDDGQGREAIGQIARKAFEAAAGQTARAGLATRNLTNLLHQGIQSWKSSLAEVKKKPVIEAHASTALPTEVDSDVSGETRANVFKPEVDLQEYLKRISSTGAGIEQDSETADHYDNEAESAERIKKPATSNKAARAASPRKKPTRPTDVEDVLAAGIGGFIEAIGQANKTKIAYGLVYVALGGLFTYACFDVSRKFPAVETIPGQQVQSATLGALNLNESQGSDEAIAKARSLVSAGKTSEAITLLQAELQSGKLLHNRDLLRIELAALLNGLGEQHLRANQFQESVARYKQALEILPSDAALQLRLGNALYYQGTLGATDSVKAGALADAANVLEAITSKNSGNLQAHRLLALVSEARGEAKTATAAWKKVKALASADSAEFKEAVSHLK